MMAINDKQLEPDTREQILMVASRLFSERGFASVSIRDICDETAITPPTIYYHFGNKDQLFQEVINRMLSLEDFWQSLFKSIEQQSDPKTKLAIFIQHYLGVFPRSFFNPGMFLQTSTKLYGESTQRVANEFKGIHKLAGMIIQEGIDSGEFRNVDPDQATEYFMTLLMAYVLVDTHYNQSDDLNKSALFITDMFLNGLCFQGSTQKSSQSNDPKWLSGIYRG